MTTKVVIFKEINPAWNLNVLVEDSKKKEPFICYATKVVKNGSILSFDIPVPKYNLKEMMLSDSIPDELLTGKVSYFLVIFFFPILFCFCIVLEIKKDFCSISDRN